MAYNRGAKATNNFEHAFVKIEKDIKVGDIPGLVLLCGREDYLVHHYRETLIGKMTAPEARALDVTRFSRDEVTAQAVGEEMESLPLMSRRKVILLDSLINDRGKFPKGSEDDPESRKKLIDTILEVPESCLVIITADKPLTSGDYNRQSTGTRLSQLKKEVEKAGGKVYDFEPLQREQLRGFVIKRFQKAGKTCTRDVLQSIMFDTGYGSKDGNYDLYLLENDLKKIIAHSGNREMITAEDIAGVLTLSPENNVFHMLEAISRGRTDQALIELDGLLADGESEFAIHSNLVRQIEIMLIARELQDRNDMGATIDYLVREEKVGKYRAERAAATSVRFRKDQLKSMLLEAIAVEENIKSGIMSPRLALEYCIAGRLR